MTIIRRTQRTAVSTSAVALLAIGALAGCGGSASGEGIEGMPAPAPAASDGGSGTEKEDSEKKATSDDGGAEHGDAQDEGAAADDQSAGSDGAAGDSGSAGDAEDEDVAAENQEAMDTTHEEKAHDATRPALLHGKSIEMRVDELEPTEDGKGYRVPDDVVEGYAEELMHSFDVTMEGTVSTTSSATLTPAEETGSPNQVFLVDGGDDLLYMIWISDTGAKLPEDVAATMESGDATTNLVPEFDESSQDPEVLAEQVGSALPGDVTCEEGFDIKNPETRTCQMGPNLIDGGEEGETSTVQVVPVHWGDDSPAETVGGLVLVTED